MYKMSFWLSASESAWIYPCLRIMQKDDLIVALLLLKWGFGGQRLAASFVDKSAGLLSWQACPGINQDLVSP